MRRKTFKRILAIAPGLKRGLLVLLALMLLNLPVCVAQKYSFSHYDIEDGLIQSQVNSLSLDKEHRLWIATFGGACRFDGKEFTPYTRQNGLPTSFINTVFTDKAGHTWFGTQSGLAQLLNKKIINYATPATLKSKIVTDIVQDGSGKIWFLIGNRLFKLNGDKIEQQSIQQDTSKKIVLALAISKEGKLYASVYKSGIYYLDKGDWLSLVTYPPSNKDMIVRKILFDKFNAGKIYLKSNDGIFVVNGNTIGPYESQLLAEVQKPLLSLEQDADGNLWIGANNGAYYIKNKHLIHFVAHNGLTDNSISYIFNDAGNNLWLASQGNGLFKYEGDHSIMFDKTQGLSDNQLVMGITKDNQDHIFLGINGGGLMCYDGKKLTPFPIHAPKQTVDDIQCLYTDKKGIMWIGTFNNGLWKYDKKVFSQVSTSDQYTINGITESAEGTILVATSSGCFSIKNNLMVHLGTFYSFVSSLLVTGKDSLIIGTQDGILLAVNNRYIKSFKLNALRTSAVYCMLKYKGLVVIGTDDRGMFTWDTKTGQVKNYSLKDGLNSNTVYGLVTDENGVIWAGTGRGVNRITFNQKKQDFSIIDNSGSKNLILESNQNAAFYIDHKIWIGTTKGVVVYNTDISTDKPLPPNIIIQNAKLLPQKIDSTDLKNSMLANGAKIPYKQNHLAISFLGIYLKNPESVTYRYRLIGLDSAYSAQVKNNVVDYPSLPAGDYTFEVKAFTNAGVASANTARFSFSVIPPFYQTATFRILGIVFFILIGILFQSYRHRIRINRQRIIEDTKRNESLRIRQQTAEDFHDELGNKLTRITVLSEMLDTKMSPDKPDQKKLLEQIRQNAASLYNGTKDILWALDPKSANLYEILCHITDFGKELFLDTQVEFEFNGIDERLSDINLPMEYSRNLPMIFKELLNNILKHAGASHVTINLNSTHNNELNLLLIDNGRGFDKNEARRGQGINNIIARTKRINGEISFNSEKGSGTAVTIKIKISHTV